MLCWREQAWPQLGFCPRLTRLRLECLPPALEHPALMEQLPKACQGLRELQFTYCYSQEELLQEELGDWVRTRHSHHP